MESRVKLYNMTMVYDGHGRVLVLDRVKSDWPGLTFPGGHVEPGESLVASAIREIYEETGLSVRGLSRAVSFTGRRKMKTAGIWNFFIGRRIFQGPP